MSEAKTERARVVYVTGGESVVECERVGLLILQWQQAIQNRKVFFVRDTIAVHPDNIVSIGPYVSPWPF